MPLRKRPTSHFNKKRLFWCSAATLAVFWAMHQNPPAPTETPTPARETLANAPDAFDMMETSGLSANYLSGRYAASIGDFSQASRALNRALALDTENGEMLGYAYRMRLVAGDMEGAAALAQKLYALKDNASNPEIMVMLSHLKKQNHLQAKNVLAGFEKGGFNIIVIPLFTSWLELESGGIPQAIKLDENLKKVPEFLPFIAYQTALINDAAGHLDVAEAQYEIALGNARMLPFRVVEMLGNLYARTGKWDKLAALETRFQSAFSENEISLTPSLPKRHEIPKPIVDNAEKGIAEILFSTGSILKGEGLQEEALIYVQQALYLNPEFSAAQLMRGAIFESLERPEDAIIAYDGLPKTSPYFLRGQLRKAYLLSENKQVAEALNLLEGLRGAHPQTNYQLALTQGDILMKEKRFSDAEGAYNAALEHAGKELASQWPVYYARGISRERQNKWGEAEKDLLKALELAPDQPDVLNYLGYSWLTQNLHVARAKAMIEQAVAARPTDGHIVDSMGWALYTIGKYEESLDYMERAIELMPYDATVNDHLGDVYWRLERKNEARFQWKRALLSNPEPELEKSLQSKLESGLPTLENVAGKQTTPKIQRADLP